MIGSKWFKVPRFLREGEAGRVYFYQNELPYDVDQEAFGDKHYAGYRVASSVQRHEAQGVGEVLTWFRSIPAW